MRAACAQAAAVASSAAAAAKASDRPKASAAGGGSGADDSRGRTLIMVVDDNEIDRMVAEGFVSDLGYQVVTASSGVKCLQILHEQMRKEPDSAEPPVHLILLDVLITVHHTPKKLV